MDFKTNDLLEDKANFDDYRFVFPIKPTEKENINPIEIEKLAREQIKNNIRKQYQLSFSGL